MQRWTPTAAPPLASESAISASAQLRKAGSSRRCRLSLRRRRPTASRSAGVARGGCCCGGGGEGDRDGDEKLMVETSMEG